VGEQTPDFAVGGIVPEATRWQIVGTDGPEPVVPLSVIEAVSGRITFEVPMTPALSGLLGVGVGALRESIRDAVRREEQRQADKAEFQRLTKAYLDALVLRLGGRCGCPVCRAYRVALDTERAEQRRMHQQYRARQIARRARRRRTR
jgi:hypothetical protein